MTQDKPSYDELAARLRRLEAELAETRDRDRKIITTLSEDFTRLADRSRDAIYRFDIESESFPFFNRRFLDLFGCEESGKRVLSGGGVVRHMHPGDRDKFVAKRKRSLRRGYMEGEDEYRIVNDDGSICWLHDKWTVIRNSGGRPVAIEGFVRDNTRRKQVEDELNLSRHNALIGRYIVQDAQFVYVNPEFCRIIAYPEQELIGTHPLTYVQPDYRAEVNRQAVAMLKGERTTPYEFRVIDKNGRAKWILETVTPIHYEGRRAILGYFMDISQSKQAEKERLEREKLQAILELAGAVSHELNNPLQVILVCFEKLDRDPSGGRLPDKKIQLIRRSIQKMLEISEKFQNITQYATMDYVDGKKILDIHAAADRDRSR